LEKFPQIGGVIHLTSSGHDLLEVYVQFDLPLQRFGVAGGDPGPEFAKTLRNELTVAIVARGAVDAVAYVHVDPNAGRSNGADEFEISIGAIRQVPAHHLDGELGPRGLDCIDDMAAVLNSGVQKLPRQIPGGWARTQIFGSYDPAISTQQRAPTASGQRGSIGDIFQIRTAFFPHPDRDVDPGSYLGNDHIFGGERLLNLDDEGGVFKELLWDSMRRYSRACGAREPTPADLRFSEKWGAQTDGAERRLPSKLRRRLPEGRGG